MRRARHICIFFTLVCALTLRSGAALAQLDRVIPDPAPCEADHFVRSNFFGRVVVPWGTDLLVGAGGGACDADSPGHGVVYLIDGPSGEAVRTFRNPLPGIGDFGIAVATLNGDIIVGAPYNLASGNVYLLNGTNANLVQSYVSPSPSANDQFGAAVAAAGGDVLVGAPLDDSTGANAGAAFLYEPLTALHLRTFTNPAAGTTRFGATVAALGSNVLIGAPAYPGPGGAVYLFDRLTGVLKKTFTSPTNNANGFGSVLAVVGSNVLVGAPFEGPDGDGAAYLFDSTSGALLHTFTDPRPESGDAFGTSLAAIGTDVLIGAPGTLPDREGIVYRFDANPVSPGFGALRQTFQRSQLVIKAKADKFGAAVSAIGSSPVIGAPGYTSEPDFAPGTVYRFDACGNGVLGAAEQCDDGNTTTADGCSWCGLELCGPSPATGCRRAPAGSSTLIVLHPDTGVPTDRSRDKLVFRWKGPATSSADFGTPRTTTSYMLCMYDASSATQPLVHAAAPAGGMCLDRPCWQNTGPVILKYKDRLKNPNGLLSILLRPGAVDGLPFLRFRGRGSSLMLPPLPLSPSVTVQIRNNETGVCWDAVYGSDVRANTTFLFKASSD